jgi:predicted dehydrogenase
MRIGMIGLRHFHAQEMIGFLAQVPGVELVAVAEEDETAYQENRAGFPGPRYADWRALLDRERPEAVGVVNVPGDRGRVVAECLRRGISVLADKPLCLTREELAEVRQAKAGSRAALFVYLTERYNPPVVTLRRLVEEGRLGRVVSFTAFRPHKLLKSNRPAWFWRRATYGGILVDLASHDVDIFRLVTGAEAEEVAAVHANLTCPEHPEFEDTGHFLLRATGGVAGLFRVDWLAPAGEPVHGDCRYFVVGTEGHAEVRLTGGFPGQSGGGVRLVTNAAPPADVPLAQPARSLVADFAAAVRGEEPAMRIGDLFRASEIVFAARESADRGTPVRLD